MLINWPNRLIPINTSSQHHCYHNQNRCYGALTHFEYPCSSLQKEKKLNHCRLNMISKFSFCCHFKKLLWWSIRFSFQYSDTLSFSTDKPIQNTTAATQNGFFHCVLLSVDSWLGSYFSSCYKILLLKEIQLHQVESRIHTCITFILTFPNG